MATAPAKQLASEIIATWPTDRPFDAQTVLGDHPEFLQYKSVVLDLAFEEFTQRLERGETVAPETFAKQFSTCRKSLVQLLEANYYLHANDIAPDELESGVGMEVGATMMGFELIEELGQGAFSRVFLARQNALGGREVVVKFYSGGREAETLGKLEHPNIVPVYSVDHDPQLEVSALCMPYFGRATLLDVLDAVYRQDELPQTAVSFHDALLNTVPEESRDPNLRAKWQRRDYVEVIAAIGQQLASALELTHSRALCHGDIKPSNVLVLSDGSCRLFDFNLSFATDAPLASLGGTLPYMAPEQLSNIVRCEAERDSGRQEPAKPLTGADARADIYAWAVTIYELLTGKHPHCAVDRDQPREQVAAALLARQIEPLTPIRSVNPRVDRELATIVEQCLKVNPDDRIQTAQQLSVVMKRHRSLPQRTWRWAKRHKAICSTVALTLAMLVVAGAVATRVPPAKIAQQEAQQAFRQGKYEKALSAYDRVVQLQPEDARAFYERGKTLLALGQVEQALKSFAEALRLSDDGKVAAWIGYELNLGIQHEAAITFYQQAIDKGIESAELYNNLGLSFMQLAQLEEAEEPLLLSLRLNPKCQEAWRNLIKLEFRLCFREDILPNLEYLQGATEAGVSAPDFELDLAFFWAMHLKHANNDVDKNRFFEQAMGAAEEALNQNIHPRRLKMLGAVNPDLRESPRYARVVGHPPPLEVAAQPPRTLPPLKESPF